MNLNNYVGKLPELSEVSFLGVADLSPAHEAAIPQASTSFSIYPRAISLGISLLHPIVDQLPHRSSRAAAMLYRHHTSDVVNHKLDLLATRVSSALQQAGHNAMPVPASQAVDAGGLLAVFPHKTAANLAGLGWIGKSCLLITPEAGPRVRLATILTDAAVEPTGKPLDERCGDCQECVDICPARAFSGRAFHPEEPADLRFAAHRCKEYHARMEKDRGFAVCGLCVYVCPHGRKENRSPQ